MKLLSLFSGFKLNFHWFKERLSSLNFGWNALHVCIQIAVVVATNYQSMCKSWGWHFFITSNQICNDIATIWCECGCSWVRLLF